MSFSLSMCLGVNLFEFTLFGVNQTSCVSLSMSFLNFGGFLAIILQNKLSASFFLLLLWLLLFIYWRDLWCSIKSLRLYSLFFILFFFWLFRVNSFKCFVFKFATSFFCLFKYFLDLFWWISLLTAFYVPEFLLVLFLIISSSLFLFSFCSYIFPISFCSFSIFLTLWAYLRLLF